MPRKTPQRSSGPGGKRRRPMNRNRNMGFRRLPRGCRLCKDKVETVDYKNSELLQKFITEHGKIISSRISGNCATHQRKVARAIRQARIMGLLPFVSE